MACVSCIFCVLYIITASNITVKSKPNKDRSINFALDAVMEFNTINENNDLKVFKKIGNVFDKFKSAFKGTVVRREFGGRKVEKLTDFLIAAINILITYNNEDLKQFLFIINEEITKYHYKGCKFDELAENLDLKQYIVSKFDKFRHQPANIIRKDLLDIASKIIHDEYGTKEKELIDFINAFYAKDAANKFRQILSNVNDYKQKNKTDLALIVRDGLRSMLFDHYTNLNASARSELKYKINEYFKSNSNLITSKKINVSKDEDINTIESDEIKQTSLNTQTIQKDIELKRDNISDLLSKTTKYTEYKNNEIIPQIERTTHQLQNGRRDELEEEDKNETSTIEAKEEHFNTNTKTNTESKHKVFLEIMTLKPFMPRKANTSKKFKYEIHLKNNIFKSQASSLKITEVNTSSLTQNPIGLLIDGTLDNNEKKYLDTLSLTTMQSIARNYKPYDITNMNHYQHLSVVSRTYTNDSGDEYYRKDNNLSLNAENNKNVISRIKYLKNELKFVKNRMKNKTVIIKNLKRKLRSYNRHPVKQATNINITIFSVDNLNTSERHTKKNAITNKTDNKKVVNDNMRYTRLYDETTDIETTNKETTQHFYSNKNNEHLKSENSRIIYKSADTKFDAYNTSKYAEHFIKNKHDINTKNKESNLFNKIKGKERNKLSKHNIKPGKSDHTTEHEFIFRNQSRKVHDVNLVESKRKLFRNSNVNSLNSDNSEMDENIKTTKPLSYTTVDYNFRALPEQLAKDIKAKMYNFNFNDIKKSKITFSITKATSITAVSSTTNTITTTKVVKFNLNSKNKTTTKTISNSKKIEKESEKTICHCFKVTMKNNNKYENKTKNNEKKIINVIKNIKEINRNCTNKTKSA